MAHQGAKLKKLQEFLRERPGVKGVWLDYMGVPQGDSPDQANAVSPHGKRDAHEQDFFRFTLDNIKMVSHARSKLVCPTVRRSTCARCCYHLNVKRHTRRIPNCLSQLYITGRVIIFLDQKYMGRFWTQYEAFLSLHATTPIGIQPKTLEDIQRRVKIIEMGAATAAGGQLKAALVATWHNKTVEEAVSVLNQPDVEVMMKADKDTLLPKLGQLAENVESFFKKEEESRSPLWVAYNKWRWTKNRLVLFERVDRINIPFCLAGCVTATIAARTDSWGATYTILTAAIAVLHAFLTVFHSYWFVRYDHAWCGKRLYELPLETKNNDLWMTADDFELEVNSREKQVSVWHLLVGALGLVLGCLILWTISNDGRDVRNAGATFAAAMYAVQVGATQVVNAMHVACLCLQCQPDTLIPLGLDMLTTWATAVVCMVNDGRFLRGNVEGDDYYDDGYRDDDETDHKNRPFSFFMALSLCMAFGQYGTERRVAASPYDSCLEGSIGGQGQGLCRLCCYPCLYGTWYYDRYYYDF